MMTHLNFRFLHFLLPVCFLNSGSYAADATNTDTDSKTTESIIAETVYGRVEGLRIEKRIEDLETVTTVFDRFYGIPYAMPPTGDLRFEPPRPPKNWSNVLETKMKKPSCPQSINRNERFYIDQSEDCLYLNVFSPFEKNQPNKTYPVMFYIHGGSYESGSGHVYDGKVMSLLGVVVVTFNYRLGVLGFLTTGDNILPGNYGLRDILLALQWVHENIKHFRGDSSRVTLVGQSVGASLVGILITMPSVKDLFWTAIAHSGSATALYSVYTKDFVDFHAYIRLVGEMLNCTVEDGDLWKLRTCFKQMDYRKFIYSRDKFPLYNNFGVEFRPLVDDDLMFEQPVEAIKAGRYHKVPFYTGVVQDEFSATIKVFSKLELIDYLNYVVDGFLNLSFACNETRKPTIINLVKQKYIDWIKTVDLNRENFRKRVTHVIDYATLINDIQMVSPAILIADLLSQTNEDVYYYYFKNNQSHHSYDLNFVLGVPFGGDNIEGIYVNKSWIDSSPEDKMLSEKMMRMWRSIFETSKPSPIESIEWPQYNTTTQHYIIFSTEPTTFDQYFQHESNGFWNKYLPQIFYEICGRSMYSYLTKPTNNTDQFDPYKQTFHDNNVLTFCFIGLAILGLLCLILLIVVIKYKRRYNKLVCDINVLSIGKST